MSPEIYLHEHPEFFDLVRVMAGQKKIDPYLAEKDYWLMHCLYGLQQAGYDFQLKGGTSLSKGYGIIHRFSEDIDICITPPEKLNVRTSKNQDKEKDRQSRKDYYDYLAKNIHIPGIVKVERDTQFDSAPNYFGGGIRLYYEAKFLSDGSAKDGVLLEAGFDEVTPNQPRDISSWALDFALDRKVSIMDNRALHVLCYNPGNTLIDKVQAIIKKFRNQQANGAALPPNFMRHYYDVSCLLQDREVQAFIGTAEYKEYKARCFREADWEVPLSENEAFLLKDKDRRASYRKEYERRASLYYQGQPPFDEVLAVIQKNLERL